MASRDVRSPVEFFGENSGDAFGVTTDFSPKPEPIEQPFAGDGQEDAPPAAPADDDDGDSGEDANPDPDRDDDSSDADDDEGEDANLDPENSDDEGEDANPELPPDPPKTARRSTKASKSRSSSS